MKIPHFWDVFMRNELLMIGPFIFESVISNLNYKDGLGTRWVG